MYVLLLVTGGMAIVKIGPKPPQSLYFYPKAGKIRYDRIQIILRIKVLMYHSAVRLGGRSVKILLLNSQQYLVGTIGCKYDKVKVKAMLWCRYIVVFIWDSIWSK